MVRLDKEFNDKRTRLTISGEIDSACTELLETCCEQAIKDGKAVHLFLDVTTIDESGRELLRRLAVKGIRIFAKGIYHAHLVDMIRRAASSNHRGSGAESRNHNLERSLPLIERKVERE